MKRRSLLNAVGVCSVSGFAGCMGLFEDEAKELAGIRIRNYRPEEYTIDLRVEIDEEVVSNEQYTVSPGEGNRIASVLAECTWPSGRHEEIVVSARRNQDEGWETISSDEIEHEDCYWVTVRIEDPGNQFYLLLWDCDTHRIGQGEEYEC